VEEAGDGNERETKGKEPQEAKEGSKERKSRTQNGFQVSL